MLVQKLLEKRKTRERVAVGTNLAMMISDAQVDSYREQGFLVLERFVDQSACDELKTHAAGLVNAFEHGSVKSIFSSLNQHRFADDYFLRSANNIFFFFEEDAFDDYGELRQPKMESINKMGHAMHDLDPVFDRFSRNPRLATVVKELGLEQPLLLQSMYIFKPPEIGGEVLCHQDATYLYTEPISVVGLWFALEDATRENGCLWALPGGHREGLKSRFYRSDKGKLTTDVIDTNDWSAETLVSLEVPKGTLVVLNGLCPHYSAPNLSAVSRHAYSLHVIDGDSRYATDNWLQRRPDLPLSGFNRSRISF